MFSCVFASMCAQKHFGFPEGLIYTSEANMSWEHARYLLEKRFGLMDKPRQKKTVQASFIIGYLWKEPIASSWRVELDMIEDEYQIQEGDKIVMVRKPMPKGHTHYIPRAYREEFLKEQELIDETHKNDTVTMLAPLTPLPIHSSEEDKIQWIMKQAHHMADHAHKISYQQTHTFRFTSYHASRPLTHPELLIPPSNYICFYCGAQGQHFRNMCTDKMKKTQIVKRRATTGIPKSMLRPAQTDKEKEMAMMTPEGEYMVYKDKFKQFEEKGEEESKQNDDPEYLQGIEYIPEPPILRHGQDLVKKRRFV